MPSRRVLPPRWLSRLCRKHPRLIWIASLTAQSSGLLTRMIWVRIPGYSPLDTWPSGLRRSPGKRMGETPHRFESCSIRTALREHHTRRGGVTAGGAVTLPQHSLVV
jgi:hypothetical protein